MWKQWQLRHLYWKIFLLAHEYEWLELVKFYAVLTCCITLTIERQWSFHGPCLKDALVQYFSMNRKRHLKVCPSLLGVHRNSKYTSVSDAVMQSLAFYVTGSILISPIPFLPSSACIVLEQPYLLLQSSNMAILAICFLLKKGIIISERTSKINNGMKHFGKSWKRNWCSFSVVKMCSWNNNHLGIFDICFQFRSKTLKNSWFVLSNIPT